MKDDLGQNQWWRGAVIYEVYVRSFQDTRADGVGDLEGVRRRLDHVAGLGVDALWLSPFYPSPGEDFGYDISDFRSVDPQLGTLDDLRTLIDEAHEAGLRVLIDMVMAHTSDQHPWFQDSRNRGDKADWYVWADPAPDGTPPNNWLSAFGGPAWSWDHRRKQYYLHDFLASQPSLNWNNPDVAAEMLDICRGWLEFGVDGLRLDAIAALLNDPELRDNPVRNDPSEVNEGGAPDSPFRMQRHTYDRDPPQLIAHLHRLRDLADRHPETFLMGEVSDVDSVAVGAKYTRGDDRLHSCYTFQLLNAEPTAEGLRALFDRFEAEMQDSWPTLMLTNHDVPRAISRWAARDHLSGDRRRLSRLMLALVLSLRGTVCLYQGQELGLTEADLSYEDLQDPFGRAYWPDYRGRDGARTPMPWEELEKNLGFSSAAPWLPPDPDHAPMAVDRQEERANSPLSWARALIDWRRETEALRTGALTWCEAPFPLLAFRRHDAEDDLLCVFNISNRAVDWQPEPGWQVLSDAPGTPDDGGRVPPFGFGYFRRA